MFRTAVKTLSLASSSFISRAVFGSRHYCKKIPTKLRVSEAVSGLNVGANIKVQVRKKNTPLCMCRFRPCIFFFNLPKSVHQHFHHVFVLELLVMHCT